jgi:hypothetical protein
MKCSKCGSGEHIRNGKVNGVQRYKCKDYGRSFTVELKRLFNFFNERIFVRILGYFSCSLQLHSLIYGAKIAVKIDKIGTKRPKLKISNSFLKGLIV